MTPKPIYTTKVYTSGGREGRSRSEDGNLDVALVMPKEFGGPGGAGTNPEQLFAAGYSACFLSALKLTVRLEKVVLSADPSISAEVGIVSVEDDYALTATLNIKLTGVDRNIAEKLVASAHAQCPYSRAIRGNIDVKLNIV